MNAEFGFYNDPPECHTDSLTLGFWATPLSQSEHWPNIGRTADFIADYFGTYLSSDDKKADICYVANEMLENSVKYHELDRASQVDFYLYMFPDEVHLYITNTITKQEAKSFQEYIQRLLNEDAQELFIQQVESNAASDSIQSELGLLTLILDYDARLGWKFEPGRDALRVTTQVRLGL